MSAFTKFLNLFKWQPDIDGDEEFDIDKSLNENWDKIDTKLETYMTDLSKDVEDFKNNTDTQVEDIAKQVSGLREISISPTTPTSNESVWIRKGKNLYNPKNAYITGNLSQNIGLIYRDIEAGHTYTFSASNYSWVSIKTYNFSNQIVRELGNTETTTDVTITIQDTEIYIELIFYSGLSNLTSTNDIDFTGVQLEQSSTATDFEEFVEEKILIKNSAGEFEEYSDVVVSPGVPAKGKVWIRKGKNEFDKRNLEIVSHWNTEYTVDSNKKITVTVPNVVQAVAYIKTSNFIIPKGQHTFSAKIEGEYSLMKLINVSNTSTSIIETATNTFTVDLAEDTTVFLYIYINPSSTENKMTIEDIQIEQGSTATDYEDYVGKEIYVKNSNGVFERFYSESEMNKHNYSATEQVIGTWIDGKPIYRKVFEGTSATQTNVTIQNHVENVDTIVHAYGQLENSTGMKLMVLSDNQSNVWANNTFTIYINNASIDTYKYKLIYEYTKTTD